MYPCLLPPVRAAPTVGAVFKDAALRQQRGVETLGGVLIQNSPLSFLVKSSIGSGRQRPEGRGRPRREVEAVLRSGETDKCARPGGHERTHALPAKS